MGEPAEMPAYRKKICLLGPGEVGKTSLARQYVEKRFDDNYQTTVGATVVRKTVQVRRYKRQPPAQAWQPAQTGSPYYQQAGFQPAAPQPEVEDVEVRLQVWDIMGQAHPQSLQATFYQGAEGALLVADLSRPETVGELDTWVENLHRVVGTVPVVLIGNKKDLVPPESLTAVEQLLQQTAARRGAQHIMTSAKTGEGVDKSFYDLGYLMVA